MIPFFPTALGGSCRRRVPCCRSSSSGSSAQTALLLPLALARAGHESFLGQRLGLAALRTVAADLSHSPLFSALRVLPLADAVGIAFSSLPFFMLLLWASITSGGRSARAAFAPCAVGFFGRSWSCSPVYRRVGGRVLPVAVAVIFSPFFML